MPAAETSRKSSPAAQPQRPKKRDAAPLVPGELLDLLGPGVPLESGLRERCEGWFAEDFETVRVHDGIAAANLANSYGANAFALGSHIVFGCARYQPETTSGRWLLAHELAHVVQQRALGQVLLQRDGPATAEPPLTEAAIDETDSEPEEPIEDEKPKYRWLNYDEAARKNRIWFDALELAPINPFAPYDPVATPNAFINRVARWQARAESARLAEFVFAGAEGQKEVRQGDLPSIATGIVEVDEKIVAGERVKLGDPIPVDGVLGPRTFWTMLAAAALSVAPKNRTILAKKGVDVDSLDPLTHDETDAWGHAWRAVHAYLFNKPFYRATWPLLIQSDIAIGTFEKLVGLDEANQEFLQKLFFPEEVPTEVELTGADYLAILARGYPGEALEGIASVIEVDREYFHAVDIHRLLQEKRPKWQHTMDLRMGEADWSRANTLIEDFSMELPTAAAAQEALDRLSDQHASGMGLLARPEGMLAALLVVFDLPERDGAFWVRTAEEYVTQKRELAEAAEAATQEHLAELQERYEERMAGTADIVKSDAMAFLELLVGNAFLPAQNAALQFQKDDAAGHDVEIIGKLQPSTSADKASALRTRAETEGYLVVQLGDKAESRWPLPFRQIELSREQASKNGMKPMAFDLIDTPHAAMHGYLPTRFSARKTEDGGCEAAQHPYELTFDSSKKDGGSGHAWENWAYIDPRIYGPLSPVLVEVREFNPDAGQLVRLGRQIGGTDRIVLRYVWTLGSSMPELSEQLWDAQGKVNLVGWIDAVLTILALGSLVAAPLMAGTEAAGSTAASQVGRAAVNAAIRQALVRALKKFIVTELIGEGLGRATYYINDDPDVPQAVKTAWNGLMVVLLIYGVGKTATQGIKAFRNLGSAAFRAEVAALEAELIAQGRGAKTELSAAEEAAQADIRRRTGEKFQAAVGEHGAPESGPGRIRTDDPRAADATKAHAGPMSANETLRGAIGEDARAALAEKTSPGTLERLAAVGDEGTIKRLHDALPVDLLTRALAAVAPDTLGKFARALEGPALRALLEGLATNPAGVSLLRAFAGDPARLSSLFEKLGAKRLIAIAGNPGADRFYRLASRADPAAVEDTLKNLGTNSRQTLDRFRALVDDVGPEAASDILNTYTGREMRSRWRAKEGMSPAQNLARLAIQRGEPTIARRGSGVPLSTAAAPQPGTHLLPEEFKAFYAIGPEATTPSSLRQSVQVVQEASAKAANHLNELLERAAAGTLTDVDLQVLPPGARATVDAFMRAGAKDANRAALYGSALQYMAEGEIRANYGGQLPPNMALRRVEVRRGKTLIPDAQLELTLEQERRFPQTNLTERAVIDWTTPGEAGKITKYRGGKPPVTYAVEIIQPGPPPARPAIVPPRPPVIPSMPDTPPDTDVDLNDPSKAP